MFKKQYEVTLCANANEVVKKLGAMDCLGKYTADIEAKNSVGHVYAMDNLVLYGFTSKVPAYKVTKMMMNKEHVKDANVVGGTVVLVLH